MADEQLATDLHRHFAAPRELVYQAFTDKHHIAAWFGPLGGQVLPDTISIDARVGGHRRLTLATYSGALSWSVETTFTEVVENERLVGDEMLIGFPALEDVDRFTLSLEFIDEDGGTRLELREGPYSAKMDAAVREFWLQSFTKLDALLAGLNEEQKDKA